MQKNLIINYSFCFLYSSLADSVLYGQIIDSTTFKMNSRLSFYSFENEAEMIIEVPSAFRSAEMIVKLSINGIIVNELITKPG